MRKQAGIFWLFFAIFLSWSKPLVADLSTKTFATLDWTVAETLLALDTPPTAIGDVESYKVWAAKPALPDNTIDLGIRLQPNLEQIYLLSKNIQGQSLHFINSSFYAQMSAKLAPFAQVSMVDFYREGNAWQNIVQATQQIAALIDKPESAEQLLSGYLQKIEQIKPLVKPFTQRPIALVQFIDTRHLRIYAENSLFGQVLSQLGFQNAWQGGHNIWGFEVIEVTQLAKLAQHLRFVVVKPYPTNIEKSLEYNTLWQHLPMAKDPLILPAIWTFGAIPSAQRFAESLAHALQFGGEKW
ncbi:iron-siderophore ABC transporter substrate-binding protein [Ursidibacter sp. B-7004-1]